MSFLATGEKERERETMIELDSGSEGEIKKETVKRERERVGERD